MLVRANPRGLVAYAAVFVLLAPMTACADPQPAEGPQPEATTVTTSQATQQPRTVDGMARIWMILFMAFQEAGVPPHQVQVIDPSRLERMPARFSDPLHKVGVQDNAEKIMLEVTQEQLVTMAEPLARVAGEPFAVDDTDGQFLLIFVTPQAWRGSSFVFQPAETPPGGPWPVWVVLKCNYGGGLVPEELYDLLRKHKPAK